MNKNILIVVVLCIALGLGVLVAVQLSSRGTTPTPDPVVNPFPVATGTPNLPSETLSLNTTTGTVVTVPNFIDTPTTSEDPVNTGYYYLGNHFPFDGSSLPASVEIPFVISYIPSTQFFNIVLYEEPLATSRIRAEQYLKQTLGISEQEMCSLKYSLSVPNFVSPIHAGESLGFSFCPGSVPLP
jgi:hypothetical protein